MLMLMEEIQDRVPVTELIHDKSSINDSSHAMFGGEAEYKEIVLPNLLPILVKHTVICILMKMASSRLEIVLQNLITMKVLIFI